MGASQVAQWWRIRLPSRRRRFKPWVGRSPQEGNGNPVQYSCLENSMDRGAWRATVHEVTKGWTRLSDWTAAAAVSEAGRSRCRKTREINGRESCRLQTMKDHSFLPFYPSKKHLANIYPLHKTPANIYFFPTWCPYHTCFAFCQNCCNIL